MRRGELSALQKNDFIYCNFLIFQLPRKIIVSKNRTINNIIKSTKNSKVRTINLDFKTSIYIYFYLKNKKESDFLFYTCLNYITNLFNSTIKKTNLRHIRFHDLRHLHASYLLANSKNKANTLKIVQERLRSF